MHVNRRRRWVYTATLKNFGIAGATIPNLTFLVGGSEIGSIGVLGPNFFVQDVEFDLPDGAIRLMNDSDCDKANLAYWVEPDQLYSMIPIESRDELDAHTVGVVTLDGAHINASFGKGAETTIVSLGAAARAGLKPTMPGATSGGDQEIKHFRIRIGDTGGGADMLVGADFFISHPVFASNSLRKMFFSYVGGPGV